MYIILPLDTITSVCNGLYLAELYSSHYISDLSDCDLLGFRCNMQPHLQCQTYPERWFPHTHKHQAVKEVISITYQSYFYRNTGNLFDYFADRRIFRSPVSRSGRRHCISTFILILFSSPTYKTIRCHNPDHSPNYYGRENLNMNL
jgi:hypothetical protein